MPMFLFLKGQCESERASTRCSPKYSPPQTFSSTCSRDRTCPRFSTSAFNRSNSMAVNSTGFSSTLTVCAPTSIDYGISDSSMNVPCQVCRKICPL